MTTEQHITTTTTTLPWRPWCRWWGGCGASVQVVLWGNYSGRCSHHEAGEARASMSGCRSRVCRVHTDTHTFTHIYTFMGSFWSLFRPLCCVLRSSVYLPPCPTIKHFSLSIFSPIIYLLPWFYKFSYQSFIILFPILLLCLLSFIVSWI